MFGVFISIEMLQEAIELAGELAKTFSTVAEIYFIYTYLAY